MKIEKILFHTRFRELAFNSLQSILELKVAGLKEIVLTHIIPLEESAFVPYGGYLKEAEEHARAQARMQFEDWQQTLEQAGIASSIRIETGITNAGILEIADQEKVDMIVVGRKKRTPLEKVYVAAHILDILRRSPIPVLMSKYMVQFEWEGELVTRVNEHIFKRPLLATDWSDPSQRGLKMLLALKGAVQKAVVAHVIGAKLSKKASPETLRELELESRKRLDAFCQELTDEGLLAESHLSMGRTAVEIIKMSREYKATMIVMGRTGKDWFEEYWLGGVSHRVAEISELPVMLVP
jgi:nucleotide-binding universal stress UspA family protein